MHRRELLTGAAALAGAAALLGGLTSCGDSSGVVRADIARARPESGRTTGTVEAVDRFGLELLKRVGTGANVVCSPLSVLVALAMVRNGAAGATATEMDHALRLPALDELNAGMNLIDQTLAERSGKRASGDRKGKVELDLANAVWGQQDDVWEEPFLRTLAADYGTGVHPTDFTDVAAACKAINSWVADRTRGKITDIATPDEVSADTRLALVDALHAKAPWAKQFQAVGGLPFDVKGGEPAQVPMIRSAASPRYRSGRGWEGACIPLLGDELALTVVLPDHDLETLVDALLRSGLGQLMKARSDELVDLTLPTFTITSEIDLKPPLVDLGLQTAFTGAAEFPGLTTTDRLELHAAKHRGYLALDENGIEAAAATVVTAVAVSGSAGPDRELVLDRPFLFVLHDVALDLPLMVGAVVDPR